MRDAALVIHRFIELLARGIITPNEFGAQAIDAMLHDEACDPAEIFCKLPAGAQAAVLNRVSQYAEKDYLVKFMYLGRGETEQDVIDRQPKLRKVCIALLNFVRK